MWRFLLGGTQNRPRHNPLANGINIRQVFQLCHQYIANYIRNPNIFALAIAVLFWLCIATMLAYCKRKLILYMINLYNCKCSSRNASAPAYLASMCVCPKIWAVASIGKVIISFNRPQGIPVVRMLWWHEPKSCPSFRSSKLTGISLLPIISPRVYQIFRRKKRRANR